MGYTHYWTLGPVKQAMWDKITHDCEKALRSNEFLCREYDKPNSLPQFGAVIRFNGKGEDGHETFVFARESGWTFCKTALKPYDIGVCAVLIIAKRHLGRSFEFSSDGEWDELRWRRACKLVENKLGYAVNGLDDDHRPPSDGY